MATARASDTGYYSTDLDNGYEKVNITSRERIEEVKPAKSGRALQSDGCTTKDHRRMVNIMESVIRVERFNDSIDCTNKKKDMKFLAAELEPHVNDDVDLVVADVACGGMLRIIEEKHPRITGMRCCAHGIDLLARDLTKSDSFTTLINRNNKVVKFIRGHQKPYGIFLTKTKLRLMAANATRFATNIIVAMRLSKLMPVLRNLTCDPDTEHYIMTTPTRPIRNAGNEVMSILLEGIQLAGEYWFELAFFVENDAPLRPPPHGGRLYSLHVEVLHGMLVLGDKWDKVCEDQAAACSSLPGEGWRDPEVLVHVDFMKEQLEKRREYVHSPMLSTAFATDPEYLHMDIHTIDQGRVKHDVGKMCERLLIDHGNDAAAAVGAAEDEDDGGPVIFGLWYSSQTGETKLSMHGSFCRRRTTWRLTIFGISSVVTIYPT